MKFSHALIVVLILHIIAVGAIFAFNSIKANQAAEMKASASKPVKVEPTAPAADATAYTAAAETAAPTTATTTVAASAVATKPKGEADSDNGKTHTVVAGETPTRIAAKYKVSVDSLLKANDLTSYSLLRVGQVLVVPGGDKNAAAPKAAAADVDTITTDIPATRSSTTKTAAASTAKTETKTPATTAASATTYVVAKGDNPYSIAKKFHVSYQQLLSTNDIKDATKMQIGQKLKIPAKKN